MRLLFVVSELPYPPSNGVRLKLASILGYMASRHDCDVLAIGGAEAVAGCEPWLKELPRLRILAAFPAEGVRFLRLRQLVHLIRGSVEWPSMRYRSKALAAAVGAAVASGRYDVVHFDLISMAHYCPEAGRAKRVLSLNDSLSLALFARGRDQRLPFTHRLAARAHGLLQLGADRKLFGLADAVHLVSEYDADWSRTRLGRRNVVHIPVAAQPDSLRVVPSSDQGRSHSLILIDALWASTQRRAARRFLAEQWPSIRGKYPAARLIIIGGAGLPPSFSCFVHSLPGVELHEWVERLPELLATVGIAVFPYSHQGGMKNRVLQCMAAGIAVVGTPSSFSGLPVHDGSEVLVAESLSGIAVRIDTLLGDVELSRVIGQRARRLISARFTQEQIGRAWEHLYQDVATGAPLRSSYSASMEGAEL